MSDAMYEEALKIVKIGNRKKVDDFIAKSRDLSDAELEDIKTRSYEDQNYDLANAADNEIISRSMMESIKTGLLPGNLQAATRYDNIYSDASDVEVGDFLGMNTKPGFNVSSYYEVVEIEIIDNDKPYTRMTVRKTNTDEECQEYIYAKGSHVSVMRDDGTPTWGMQHLEATGRI